MAPQLRDAGRLARAHDSVQGPVGRSRERRDGVARVPRAAGGGHPALSRRPGSRSEEHTSELQSQSNLVCRLLLEKKKKKKYTRQIVKRRYSLSQLTR